MTLRVTIDETACSGYGNCAFAAPDVFGLNPDTGIATLRPGHPLEADRAAVDEAVTDCPVQAITLSVP